MTVKVCDALCGSGKTSACINMMNARTDQKFIFVTQYLAEVERIIEGCKPRDFKAPEMDLSTGTTKLSDIQRLIAAGENIATTHALFLSYTAEVKELIKSNQYVLVLDEVVDVICNAEIAECDMDLLRKSHMIEEEDDRVNWIGEEYIDSVHGRFRDEMLRARSQNFLRFDQEYFFWAIAPELFTSFSDVYVLTYLFDAQSLRCFFNMYDIPFEYVGTKQEDGGYWFCAPEEMDRARELRDKIHVLNNEKLNAIGSRRTSLSFSWFSHAVSGGKDEIDTLRRNLSNVFKNVFGCSARESLWTTFKAHEQKLSGKGYSSGFIPYNLRASNRYADRKYLAYCVNNFPRPWECKYYREHGVEVNPDMYALSTIVQWVFRSAIRKGEEVWLYIPSKRMRTIFLQWMDNLAEGRDLEPIHYKTPRKPRGKVTKNVTLKMK